MPIFERATKDGNFAVELHINDNLDSFDYDEVKAFATILEQTAGVLRMVMDSDDRDALVQALGGGKPS